MTRKMNEASPHSEDASLNLIVSLNNTVSVLYKVLQNKVLQDYASSFFTWS